MFKIKFPTKRIFRIFPILRIKGMAPFCNLFMERPSYKSHNSLYRCRIHLHLIMAKTRKHSSESLRFSRAGCVSQWACGRLGIRACGLHTSDKCHVHTGRSCSWDGPYTQGSTSVAHKPHRDSHYVSAQSVTS